MTTVAEPRHTGRPLLQRLFSKGSGGEGVLPLAALSALYFFDEFDTAAFGTLAPDIQRSFGLDDSQFLSLVVLNITVTAILAVPLGYLGDRVRRTHLVVLSGVLAGVFSLLTGFAGSVAVLALARFGNGVGLLANSTVHRSLLADYYSEPVRPAAYATHTNALYLGAVVGPLFAGTVGALFGWRVAFVVLIVPILAVTYLTSKLVEPVRGGLGDPAAPDAVRDRAPLSFTRSCRLIASVRTLRYQYLAAVLFGAAFVPMAVYLPLFYEREFGLGPFQRGLLEALRSFVTFLALLRSGAVTTRWFALGPQEPLRRAGLCLTIVGAGVLGTVLSPTLWIAVPISLVGAYALGFFYAPFYSIQALVSPARVRTLSFSLLGVFIVVGGILLFVSGLANLSDTYGIRIGLAVVCPAMICSGLLIRFSSRFAEADARTALRDQVLAEQPPAAADDGILLRCAGVEAAYGQVQVLFDVDLEVRSGEILALLGTNGAGKSTVLRVISGLLPPFAGRVLLDGEDVTGLSPRALVERGIVQMPGGRSVFPTLTIAESLRLAGWMYKRSDPAHVKQATAQVLRYFPVLAERQDQLAGDLSGGEQQMLGLAMAFIAKPRLLMIDELSLGLAPIVVGQLVDIVRQVNAAGTTVVLVEQSVNIALTLAQRAIFMEKGEVRFSGPTAELLERGDLLRSVYLEGAGGGRGSAATVRERRPAPAPDAVPLLAATGLVKSFGGIRATNDVSFALRPREVLGVIGPNGAGKTTLLDLVSGYLPPDQGRVHLLGQDVSSWPADRRAFAGLSRSFQDARLFPSLTAAENLALAFERHLEVRDMLAAALGLPEVGRSETHVALTVHELLDLLGLQAFAHKFLFELSTGSRRIVDIGMALAHRPDVLILDEPSSGIAQREAEALGPLLTRIHDELGCSLLVIEHDMPLLLGISDRLIALDAGTLIAEGLPQDVIKDPKVVAAYLDTDEAVRNRSGAATPSAPHRPTRRATAALVGAGSRPTRPAPTQRATSRPSGDT